MTTGRINQIIHVRVLSLPRTLLRSSNFRQHSCIIGLNSARRKIYLNQPKVRIPSVGFPQAADRFPARPTSGLRGFDRFLRASCRTNSTNCRGFNFCPLPIEGFHRPASSRYNQRSGSDDIVLSKHFSSRRDGDATHRRSSFFLCPRKIREENPKAGLALNLNAIVLAIDNEYRRAVRSAGMSDGPFILARIPHRSSRSRPRPRFVVVPGYP